MLLSICQMRFGDMFFLAASTVPGGDYDILTLSDETDVPSFKPSIDTVSATRPLIENDQEAINLESIASGSPSIIGATLATVLGDSCIADASPADAGKPFSWARFAIRLLLPMWTTQT
jgi:hypothetical protein